MMEIPGPCPKCGETRLSQNLHFECRTPGKATRIFFECASCGSVRLEVRASPKKPFTIQDAFYIHDFLKSAGIL